MIAIVDLPLPPWAYEELSDEFNDFLVGCFIKIELFRPSPTDLLQHPWVVEVGGGGGEGDGEGGERRSLPYEHFHDMRKMKEERAEEEDEEEGSSDLSSCPKTPSTGSKKGGEGGEIIKKEEGGEGGESSSKSPNPGQGKGGEEEDEAETVSEYTLCSEKEEEDSFGSPRRGTVMGGNSTPTRLREMGRCDSGKRREKGGRRGEEGGGREGEGGGEWRRGGKIVSCLKTDFLFFISLL